MVQAWIVDDEEAILALMAVALDRVQVTSQTFSSIKGVVQTLDAGVALPDVCIVDWSMSDGSAMEIRHRFPGVRFVVMSGDPEVRRLLPEGIGWLEKPFRLQTLHEVVLERDSELQE